MEEQVGGAMEERVRGKQHTREWPIQGLRRSTPWREHHGSREALKTERKQHTSVSATEGMGSGRDAHDRVRAAHDGGSNTEHRGQIFGRRSTQGRELENVHAA